MTGIASAMRRGWRELKQNWPSATTAVAGALCIECCSVSLSLFHSPMSRESEMNFALSTNTLRPSKSCWPYAQLRVNNSSVHLLRAEKVLRAILGFNSQRPPHSTVFPKQRETRAAMTMIKL